MKLNKKRVKEICVYTLLVFAILYGFPLFFTFIFNKILEMEFLKLYIVCELIWHFGYILVSSIFDTSEVEING